MSVESQESFRPMPIATELPGTKSRWITDGAWITGLVGLIAVNAVAIWYHITDALQHGVRIGNWHITTLFDDTLLLALGIITSAMLISEGIRLYRWDKERFICLDPEIKVGRFWKFLSKVSVSYLSGFLLLGLTFWLYNNLNEYGFKRQSPYYQPWFRFLEHLWIGYLWFGLPYTLITRALKADADADARDLSTTFLKHLHYLLSRIPFVSISRPEYLSSDKKNTLGYLVKFFFAPLMTVFFCDQFPHLVNNMGYISDGLITTIKSGTYSLSLLNTDLYNISIAFIFSIDVALAWCGYVISSRWVENQTQSAEPTLLGWLVCLMCYPPFQQTTGLFLTPPSERAIHEVGIDWVITLFTSLTVISYLVYMSATLCFGVRFSNLTNRGIIRTGPFAIVRHPAYASKNFAWWFLMFPGTIYTFYRAGWTEGLEMFLYHTAALVFMTTLYYFRAVTEERHLNKDPYYQAYCEQVKYRFIPGIL